MCAVVSYFTDVDQGKCIMLMTKLLYLLGKGENFSSKESTESIFFPMTKLFQVALT